MTLTTAGKRERFAVEAEILDCEADAVYGRFRIWLCGAEVGDWDDVAHLTGCRAWLPTLLEEARDRREPGLDHLSAEDVFRLAWEPAFVETAATPIERPYERFHVGHVGMSSFEHFDVLLIAEAPATLRFVWRRVGGGLQDCRVAVDEVRAIVESFCGEFDERVRRLRTARS